MNPDTKMKLNVATSIISVLLIITLAVSAWVMFTFPQSKEYSEYQANKPIINAFNQCWKEHPKAGCMIVSVDSAAGTYTRFINSTSVNWSVTK